MKKVRQEKILNLLKTKKNLSTEDLAFRFNVTTQTIRRDLEDLEKMGLVSKMYGGATLINPDEDHRSFATFFSDTPYLEEKEKIAEAAQALVEDGNTIAIDTGSTTRLLGRELRKKNDLLIITRDVVLAAYLATHPTNKVYIPGGFIVDQFKTQGEDVTEFLDSLTQLDFFFFSAGGVTMNDGFTTSYPVSEKFMDAVMPKSKNRIALMDSSKFGSTCLYHGAKLEEATHIITDSAVDKKASAEIGALGINIIISK